VLSSASIAVSVKRKAKEKGSGGTRLKYHEVFESFGTKYLQLFESAGVRIMFVLCCPLIQLPPDAVESGSVTNTGFK